MFRKMATNSENIGKSLKSVLERIQKAADSRPKSLPPIQPRLVAVTKTKPVSDIVAAYQHGQRHFGENYVVELEEKCRHELIVEHCKDIKWHFIGHLQRNKANKVAITPNLYMIETVDSQKLAQTINNHWEKYRRPGKLHVMIQVNTSAETNKSGCDPENLLHLVKFVRDKCPCLTFSGIMTIGTIGYDPVNGPNPDFLALVKCREDLCRELGIGIEDVELSMGMSSDYEHAIGLGSSNVRVGSTIFGARNVPQTDSTPIASAVAEGQSTLSTQGNSQSETSSETPPLSQDTSPSTETPPTQGKNQSENITSETPPSQDTNQSNNTDINIGVASIDISK